MDIAGDCSARVDRREFVIEASGDENETYAGLFKRPVIIHKRHHFLPEVGASVSDTRDLDAPPLPVLTKDTYHNDSDNREPVRNDDVDEVTHVLTVADDDHDDSGANVSELQATPTPRLADSSGAWPDTKVSNPESIHFIRSHLGSDSEGSAEHYMPLQVMSDSSNKERRNNKDTEEKVVDVCGDEGAEENLAEDLDKEDKRTADPNFHAFSVPSPYKLEMDHNQLSDNQGYVTSRDVRLCPTSDVVTATKDRRNNDDKEDGGRGGAGVFHKFERSFSIDEDGRKMQVSNRHLQRRKTVEVDKDDLSGLEAKHTSYLNITVGSDRSEGVEPLQKSEVNIVWGKTVETDDVGSQRNSTGLYRSELLLNPYLNKSSDDSTDYWSADMSSDTMITSDSNDTFIETGDSLYASDASDSFLERSEAHFLVSPSPSRETTYVTLYQDDSGTDVKVTNNFAETHAANSKNAFIVDKDPAKKPDSGPNMSRDSITTLNFEPDVSGALEDPKLSLADDSHELSQADQADRKALFKVSYNIASLGRGPHAKSEPRSHRQFFLSNPNSEAVVQDFDIKSGEKLSNAEDRKELFIPDNTKMTDSSYSLRPSQEDLLDMQSESDTVLRLDQSVNIDQRKILEGSSAYFNVSNKNRDDCKSGSVSHRDDERKDRYRFRPSQEEIRFVHAEGDIISGVKESHSESIDDTGTVHFHNDNNRVQGKTEDESPVQNDMESSQDINSVHESDSTVLHKKSEPELPEVFSECANQDHSHVTHKDRMAVVSPDSSSENIDKVCDKQSLGVTEQEISDIENMPESNDSWNIKDKGQGEITESENLGSNNISGPVISKADNTARYMSEDEAVPAHVCEHHEEFTDVQQRADSIRPDRVSSSNTISTGTHVTPESKLEKQEPAISSEPGADISPQKAGSADEDEDGFILVTSRRRKKKARNKKDKALAVDRNVPSAFVDGVSSDLSTNVDDSVSGEVSTIVDDSVSDEVSTTVDDSVSGEVSTTVDDSVSGEVSTTVDDNVSGEVSTTVDNNVSSDVSPAFVDDSVSGEVSTAVDNNVSDDVSTTVDDSISGEVSTTVDNSVSGEVSTALDDGISGEVSTTVDDSVSVEISTTVDDSFTDEVSTEVDNDANGEVATTLDAKARERVSEEIDLGKVEADKPFNIVSSHLFGESTLGTVSAQSDTENGDKTTPAYPALQHMLKITSKQEDVGITKPASERAGNEDIPSFIGEEADTKNRNPSTTEHQGDNINDTDNDGTGPKDNEKESGELAEPYDDSFGFFINQTREEQDTSAENVSEGLQVEENSTHRGSADERINADEFISRILEGTDVRSLGHMEDFLHSDESGGFLLNMYTAGHRRILKPHRRFTKSPGEAKSKVNNGSEGDVTAALVDPLIAVGDSLEKPLDEKCPVDVSANVDNTDTHHDLSRKVKRKGKGHKRKRFGANKLEPPLADADSSEPNMSGDSGSVDVSFEDLEDIGSYFDVSHSSSQAGDDKHVGASVDIQSNSTDEHSSISVDGDPDTNVDRETSRVGIDSVGVIAEHETHKLDNRHEQTLEDIGVKIDLEDNTAKLEADRLKVDKLETDKLKADKMKVDKLETDKLEAHKIEVEELEADEVAVDIDRLEAEKLEVDKLEANILEADRLEAGRMPFKSSEESQIIALEKDLNMDSQELEPADTTRDKSYKEEKEIQQYLAVGEQTGELTGVSSTKFVDILDSTITGADDNDFCVLSENIQTRQQIEDIVDVASSQEEEIDMKNELGATETADSASDSEVIRKQDITVDRSESFLDVQAPAKLAPVKLSGAGNKILPERQKDNTVTDRRPYAIFESEIDRRVLLHREDEKTYGLLNEERIEANMGGDGQVVACVGPKHATVEAELIPSRPLTHRHCHEDEDAVFLGITANIEELLNEPEDADKDGEVSAADDSAENEVWKSEDIGGVKWESGEENGEEETKSDQAENMQEARDKSSVVEILKKADDVWRKLEDVGDVDGSKHEEKRIDQADKSREIDDNAEVIEIDKRADDAGWKVEDNGDLNWESDDEKEVDVGQNDDADKRVEMKDSAAVIEIYDKGDDVEWRVEDIGDVKWESDDESEGDKVQTNGLDKCQEIRDNGIIIDEIGKDDNEGLRVEDASDVKLESSQFNKNKETRDDSLVTQSDKKIDNEEWRLEDNGDVKWEDEGEVRNYEASKWIEMKDKDEVVEIDKKTDDLPSRFHDVDDVKWGEDNENKTNKTQADEADDKRTELKDSAKVIEIDKKDDDVGWKIDDIGNIEWESDDDAIESSRTDKNRDEASSIVIDKSRDNEVWGVDDIGDVKWESDGEKEADEEQNDRADENEEIRDNAVMNEVDNVEDFPWKVDDAGDMKWGNDEEKDTGEEQKDENDKMPVITYYAAGEEQKDEDDKRGEITDYAAGEGQKDEDDKRGEITDYAAGEGQKDEDDKRPEITDYAAGEGQEDEDDKRPEITDYAAGEGQKDEDDKRPEITDYAAGEGQEDEDDKRPEITDYAAGEGQKDEDDKRPEITDYAVSEGQEDEDDKRPEITDYAAGEGQKDEDDKRPEITDYAAGEGQRDEDDKRAEITDYAAGEEQKDEDDKRVEITDYAAGEEQKDEYDKKAEITDYTADEGQRDEDDKRPEITDYAAGEGQRDEDDKRAEITDYAAGEGQKDEDNKRAEITDYAAGEGQKDEDDKRPEIIEYAAGEGQKDEDDKRAEITDYAADEGQRDEDDKSPEITDYAAGEEQKDEDDKRAEITDYVAGEGQRDEDDKSSEITDYAAGEEQKDEDDKRVEITDYAAGERQRDEDDKRAEITHYAAGEEQKDEDDKRAEITDYAADEEQKDEDNKRAEITHYAAGEEQKDEGDKRAEITDYAADEEQNDEDDNRAKITDYAAGEGQKDEDNKRAEITDYAAGIEMCKKSYVDEWRIEDIGDIKWESDDENEYEVAKNDNVDMSQKIKDSTAVIETDNRGDYVGRKVEDFSDVKGKGDDKNNGELVENYQAESSEEITNKISGFHIDKEIDKETWRAEDIGDITWGSHDEKETDEAQRDEEQHDDDDKRTGNKDYDTVIETGKKPDVDEWRVEVIGDVKWESDDENETDEVKVDQADNSREVADKAAVIEVDDTLNDVRWTNEDIGNVKWGNDDENEADEGHSDEADKSQEIRTSAPTIEQVDTDTDVGWKIEDIGDVKWESDDENEADEEHYDEHDKKEIKDDSAVIKVDDTINYGGWKTENSDDVKWDDESEEEACDSLEIKTFKTADDEADDTWRKMKDVGSVSSEIDDNDDDENEGRMNGQRNASQNVRDASVVVDISVGDVRFKDEDSDVQVTNDEKDKEGSDGEDGERHEDEDKDRTLKGNMAKIEDKNCEVKKNRDSVINMRKQEDNVSKKDTEIVEPGEGEYKDIKKENGEVEESEELHGRFIDVDERSREIDGGEFNENRIQDKRRENETDNSAKNIIEKEISEGSEDNSTSFRVVLEAQDASIQGFDVAMEHEIERQENFIQEETVKVLTFSRPVASMGSESPSGGQVLVVEGPEMKFDVIDILPPHQDLFSAVSETRARDIPESRDSGSDQPRDNSIANSSSVAVDASLALTSSEKKETRSDLKKKKHKKKKNKHKRKEAQTPEAAGNVTGSFGETRDCTSGNTRGVVAITERASVVEPDTKQVSGTRSSGDTDEAGHRSVRSDIVSDIKAEEDDDTKSMEISSKGLYANYDTEKPRKTDDAELDDTEDTANNDKNNLTSYIDHVFETTTEQILNENSVDLLEARDLQKLDVSEKDGFLETVQPGHVHCSESHMENIEPEQLVCGKETEKMAGDGTIDRLDISLCIDLKCESEKWADFFVDRREECLPDPVRTTAKRILQDVVSTRAQADQLVAEHPRESQTEIIHDSSSSSEEPTLTPAGHLMKEITLLETSASDQWESLKLAVSQQERYEAEIAYLAAAIDEAQRKLQESPVTASSVGALKQQISDRNKLTEQIKQYQNKVSEIYERSRQLALDSAQLSPSVFRKHYHPESAYMDYFAAMALYKRGVSPLFVPGGLFYDSLPVFEASSDIDPESIPAWMKDPNLVFQFSRPLDHHTNADGNACDISLELPRKIPPPRTDSIPRPTWSGEMLSSVSGAERSRATSTSQSLDSPRLMAKTWETSASSPRFIDSETPSPEYIGTSLTSSSITESGPHVSSDIPASANHTASCDSGMDNGAPLSSSEVFQFQTDSPSSVSSIAEKLKSVVENKPKQAPVGGRPTEILRMQSSFDGDEMKHSEKLTPPTSDDLDSLDQSIQVSWSQETPSDNWNSVSEANQISSEDPSFGSVSATSTPKSAKTNHDQKVRDRISSLETEESTDERGHVKDRDNEKVDSLQEEAKERELQAALQRHERYQKAADGLIARMEQAIIRLTPSPASVGSPLETRIKDYQETLAEIETIRNDIAKVRGMGDQLLDSPDSEGHKAVEATLAALTDKFGNLEIMANEEGRSLEEAKQKNRKHRTALEVYKKQMEDLQTWLKEKKDQEEAIKLSPDDSASLQAGLEENMRTLEEINSRLQELSDLELQFSSLCRDEEPTSVDKLHSDLMLLKKDLEQFKLDTAERVVQVQNAIQETEKRKLEKDVKSEADGELKLMTDKDSDSGADVFAPEQMDIHKELAADIRNHKQLVSQIADQKWLSGPSSACIKDYDEEIRDGWERLSNDLVQKKESLESVLKLNKVGEAMIPSQNASSRHSDCSKKLGEVMSAIEDFCDRCSRLHVQREEGQLQSDESLTLQEQCQSTLQNVSSWLDLAQQQLFTGPAAVEEQITQNENLQRQIRNLQVQVTAMKEHADDLLASTNSANQDLVDKCYRSITERVRLIEDTSRSQAEELHQSDREQKQYSYEIAELKRLLQDTQKLILQPTSTLSLDQLLSHNQKIEAQLKKCEVQLGELRSRESSLTHSLHKGDFSPELAVLQSKYMDLQRKALEKKSALQKLVTVQDQYQKMLNDCAAFLDTAQDKLHLESITARDLNHLKQQLAAHKDFFSDLEVHKAILDSLASKCDPATRTSFQQQHSSLSNQTYVLVDQASLHGQRLERLVHQWTELDEKYVRLQKVLSSLESQMPQPIANGDSLTTIRDKLSKYGLLQLDLASERDNVFEVVDKGKHILHNVNCPALETAITDLANKWISFNADITRELKRTETLGDQLSVFESEAAVLSSWLSTAKMKQASLSQMSASDLQNIVAVRSRIEKVLEFHKEVENQLPLKNKVIAFGNQLLQNKDYDTRGLAKRLRDYEEEWTQLEKGTIAMQEYFVHAQMKLMPSRQALGELMVWIEELGQLVQQDATSRTRSMTDTQIMMKKYKGYRIDLANKQMTLDFVNQQVLAPRPGQVDVPEEKLEFAEKLAELNKKWKKLVKDVNDRLKALEGVHNKWNDYEKTLGGIQSWFHEQEDKIKQYKMIGQDIGVKQNLKDCKALQQQLQVKQSDIASIKSLGSYLIDASRESLDSQQSVKDSLWGLDQNWRRLEEQTNQLESQLKDTLALWSQYQSDLGALNQVLVPAEYTLSHDSLVRGDVATLRSHMDKLKTLLADLNKHSGHLETFSALARRLGQVCEPKVQADIQKTVSDIQTKWKQVTADLMVRDKQLENSLNQWQKFEEKYSKLQDWLGSMESLLTDFTINLEDSLTRPESLANCKQLLRDFEGGQSQVSELYRMSDSLMKDINPSTVSVITSRLAAVDQRMLSLRQILLDHSAILTNNLSMLRRFNEAFEVIKEFLSHAEDVLTGDDPTKATEEKDIQSRLSELQQLLLLFSTNFVKLDNVNDLGYRLALSEADATRLKELNHKWKRLYEDTGDRSRTLQSHLLQQQDFTTKCESWMTFLAQTEQNLAKEIKGNFSDLTEQLQKFEQFESEMDSRQQILHAIISDSQKMLRAGEVEDKDEFQKKLHQLSEQWQSLFRRASQRKTVIEQMVHQWQEFHKLSQQLREWLQVKENDLNVSELDSKSLEVIRNVAEKVQAFKDEFILQEPNFNKIHDLGNTLLLHADDKAAKEIKDIQSDLTDQWHRLLSALDDHQSQLDNVDHQWLECEGGIDDMQNWMKDIRSIVNTDIPTTYDSLQTEIERCKDIEAHFSETEDRTQQLLAKEKQLSKKVQTEDMNLLHQRIHLLTKQKEELLHQTYAREQRITEALFRWTNLGEHIQSLMDWTEDMTLKVVSSRDMHVEDLLGKLENEYKREMEDRELQKIKIVEQGRQLIHVSSDIRASDIEQKLLRLEEKWQHLKGVIDFRQRKLRETVLAVKQLDTSMRNLTQWLSAVENELNGGISFKDTGLMEIQAKLQDSHELQQDIDRHSAGVSAVLNLCEVLLHDADACPTETEFMALQNAMRNLEQRWQNICALSPQRRIRVEETWHQWEAFREDCKRFSNWMTHAERDIQLSESEVTNVKAAKASFKKYENLQHDIHDHLSDLEHINRRYCKLVKEGCADADGSMRVNMTELNNRWDALQLRVTEIMKKLRHSSKIREDFEATRQSLITWLTEIDAQLNNLQQPCNLDLQSQVKEIWRIEDEVYAKKHRMKYLEQAGVYLMQKGDSQAALQVQQELDEFRSFSGGVLDRVAITKRRIERMVVAQVEDTSSVYEDKSWHTRELQNVEGMSEIERKNAELERYLEESPPESSPEIHVRVSLSPSRNKTSLVLQRSNSPSFLKSRSRSSSRKSGTTRKSISPQRRISPGGKSSSCADSRALPGHDVATLEKAAKIDVLMEQLVETLDDCNIKLARLDKSLGPFEDHEQSMQSFMECEIVIDDVQRLHRLLKTETGLTTIDSADAQVKFVVQRWENLQRQYKDHNVRKSQEKHNLIQFANDIEVMLAWLDEAENLQSLHQCLPSDIAQLEVLVKQYKDFQPKLESKKPIVLSLNMLNKKHLRTKSVETRRLQGKLQEMNRRWEQVLSRATDIHRSLQLSLIRCREFHDTIDDYQLWLEKIESRIRHCEPINLSADELVLKEKHLKLVELHAELKRNEAKVLALKKIADQLLMNAETPEISTARDQMYIAHKRVQSLLHLTAAYISSLENRFQTLPKRGGTPGSFGQSTGRSSGFGSSSRSLSPLQPRPLSLRTGSRLSFTAPRQLLSRIMSPLLRSITQDRNNLQSTEPKSSVAVIQENTSKVRPNRLMRVLRAALPIQLLLLLLFLLFFLIPVCEDEYSCMLSNNFRHSLSPMLRYTNGAPPI